MSHGSLPETPSRVGLTKRERKIRAHAMQAAVFRFRGETEAAKREEKRMEAHIRRGEKRK